MFAKFNTRFIQQDVELGYMAKVTQGFSGADLTEICQRVSCQFLLYNFWAFPLNQLLARSFFIFNILNLPKYVLDSVGEYC